MGPRLLDLLPRLSGVRTFMRGSGDKFVQLIGLLRQPLARMDEGGFSELGVPPRKENGAYVLTSKIRCARLNTV